MKLLYQRFSVFKWPHYYIRLLSFSSAFVKFIIPVFPGTFFLCCYHRDNPYQQGAFGCQAHRLSQERDTGEQVFPWHDHQSSEKKVFVWLWRCFLGSRRPSSGGTATRFVTTGWQLRQSGIQLGEIHSRNWNEFTWETAAPRRLLAVNTVHTYQPVCAWIWSEAWAVGKTSSLRNMPQVFQLQGLSRTSPREPDTVKYRSKRGTLPISQSCSLGCSVNAASWNLSLCNWQRLHVQCQEASIL